MYKAMRRSGWRNRIIIAALSLLMLIPSQFVPVSAQVSTGDLFYFHDNSILYRNENSSVTVIAEANLEPPNETLATTIDVAANIRNVTTPIGTIWVGSASWVSQPLSQFKVLQGIVTITAWLSSNESQPPFSGIGAGIAIIDNQNNLVGQPVHSYSYGQGSVLTAQPKSYEFRLNINTNVLQGQRFVFAVGLGGTTQGWKMKIYYDSSQYPSRAEIPATVSVVSEPATPLMTAFSVAIAAILLFRSRRSNIMGHIDRA